MVVIFGFGPGSPEDLGEVALCVCPNCHNQVCSSTTSGRADGIIADSVAGQLMLHELSY